MRHDPTFWLLARASGLDRLCDADALDSRRAGTEVTAIRLLRPVALTEVHRALALIGLGALARHATRSCSTRR